ncbi:DUF2334 domain-containing protein [Halohasta salina]|uniref:DUF2334 domain-containing protein n=1 Tax=Halohasta salina TaxID=2961621 RepID=UPI0020A6084E|nr:DUF2334 domain-containing protein [Halohasta salina]
MTRALGRRRLLATLCGTAVAGAGCLGSRDDGPVRGSTSSESLAVDGTEYDSIVVFRNDDPAPWTDLETLRAVTDVFVRTETPVTYSVVVSDDNADERLDADHAVAAYLDDLRADHGDLVDLAVHGYTHTKETEFLGRSEFGGLNAAAQRDRITAATDLFDDHGWDTDVFVPPYNTYDETTADVLADEGFSLVSGNWYTLEDQFDVEGYQLDGDLTHLPMNLSMEDWDTESVRDIETLKRGIDRNNEASGLNVIMLHYYFYADQQQRETLEELVEYATAGDTKALTLGEVADKLDAGAIAPTEDGWIVDE